MNYPTKETIGPKAQKVYDKAFCDALEQGLPLDECELHADMVLLEWSQPIDLPDAPASAWTGEEDCLGVPTQ